MKRSFSYNNKDNNDDEDDDDNNSGLKFDRFNVPSHPIPNIHTVIINANLIVL